MAAAAGMYLEFATGLGSVFAAQVEVEPAAGQEEDGVSRQYLKLQEWTDKTLQ